MEVGGTSSDCVRVVLLSRDLTLGSRVVGVCPARVELLQVASGYEAGAEILAAPVAALAIDFRALGPGHAGLLRLADRMAVELLGLGVPPAGAQEELSEVRLVSERELSEILPALSPPPAAKQGPEADGIYEPVRPETPKPPQPEPQVPEETQAALADGRPAPRPAAVEPTAEESAPPRRTRTRRKKRPIALDGEQTDAPVESPAAPKPAESAAAGTAPSLGSLLTPEELAALLESES